LCEPNGTVPGRIDNPFGGGALRKSLVAALAAATALGGASAALAQGSGGSLQVTVKPGKAGTKKKPRASSLRLRIVNGNTALTAKSIDILLPKNAVISTKGRKFCSVDELVAPGAPGCPKSSKVGSGTASALVGVGTPQPTRLTFKVTAVLLSKKKIGFGLYGQELAVNVPAIGTLKRASGKYGARLSIAIPTQARQPVPGAYAGLVSLDTTLGATKGKNPFLATNGCPKNGRHPFAATITFEPNPNPPVPSRVSFDASAKCS
jgi:hypothetical protein